MAGCRRLQFRAGGAACRRRGPQRATHRIQQKVPGPKTVKNRLHLDLVSGTFDAATARLLRLGAQRLRDLQTDEARWTTFADIEGNEFDLIARWPSRPAHCAFGRLNAGQRRRRSMGNQGGSPRRRHGQPTRPFSGPICRLLPPARAADEVEQCLVNLVGVGPDDRVRPARDDGGAGVVQQRGKPAAGGLVGQDTILVAVDDQDRDADLG